MQNILFAGNKSCCFIVSVFNKSGLIGIFGFIGNFDFAAVDNELDCCCVNGFDAVCVINS